MKDIEKKRQREQKVLQQMITLYCRKNHKRESQNSLCPTCRQLMEYASQRSAHCPFMAEKTFCVNCKVHCYRPDMQERIREVMRFSGPRMLFYHPYLVLWHLISSTREKRKRGSS